MTEFRKELKKLKESLEGNPNLTLKQALRGFAGIKPGDLVGFQYNLKTPTGVIKTQKMALVVAARKGRGVYLSPRDNLLMSCFRVHDAPEEILNLVIKNLYKNRTKCTYQGIINAVEKILGKYSFRTYNIRRIVYFNQVIINDPPK